MYMQKTAIFMNAGKGNLSKDNQKPLVGDNVEITVLDQEKAEGNLVKILPRKNSLIVPQWQMWIRHL